jgi:hypothetical protein
MDVEDRKSIQGEGPGWLIKIHQDNWAKIRGDGMTSLVHFQNENYAHLDTYRENSFDYFYVPMALASPVKYNVLNSRASNGLSCVLLIETL